MRKQTQQQRKNFIKTTEVAEYFSATGVPYVIKKLKISKYIKSLIAVIIAVILVLSTVYGVILWEEHQAIMRQEAVIVDEIIE